MDLVEQIKHQLAEGALSHLGSLIGASEGETKSAVNAAVPSVLSALSNLVTGGGAAKLASALGQFETGSLGHVSHMLSSQPGAVLEQGNSILNSLFGSGVLSSIVGALSRYAGINAGSANKLLAYLMPLVLGAIASRFAGKGGITAQGLTNLFAEQKSSIAKAMPSGISLPDLHGAVAGAAATTAASGREAARVVEEAVKPAAPPVMKWLLPVLGVIAAAAILWYIFGRTPAPKAPDFAQLNTDVTGSFKTLTDSLGGIKDAASAETALPKLKELDTKLDGMKAAAEKLSEADKTKIADVIKASLGKVEDQFAKLVWIPGVGEKIKSTVDGIMSKMAAIANVPVPKVSAVSAGLADTFSSLTAALGGMTSSADAEKALPKLTEISEKLGSAKGALEGLTESGRSTIVGMIKEAMTKLEGVSNKVLAMTGLDDKVKTVLVAIMDKVKDLTKLA
jgi:hypothetical protein